MAAMQSTSVITRREQAEIRRANESGEQPVVFVHGLWLLANSWDNWRAHFEVQGFTTLAPGWPDDPETVAEAHQRPDVFAGKSVGQVTNHYADVIRQLARKPIVIGHSFGGLITEKLAGMGLAVSSVAIDPAPFRGVLPLPLSALKSGFPVLGNPLNAKRSVTLTLAQFRFAFANAVSEGEARNLYATYHVPGAGLPLFQAAFANLNPWTEASVNTRVSDRGPLLVISGQKDNTVPWAIANASYKQNLRSKSPTEITEIPNRGHSLTIDSGWQEVADTALRFIERQRLSVPAAQPGAATRLVVEPARATA